MTSALECANTVSVDHDSFLSLNFLLRGQIPVRLLNEHVNQWTGVKQKMKKQMANLNKATRGLKFRKNHKSREC